ncbi:MAG TPA: molybdopterin-dependent oxidoreductase [Candidatus Sulfomarinibacteraceae bacterium]|nr:molybdopterin-dependent oxidoreductase [Candidatus Sulfomarinibacteraceae bacterium]
MKRLLLIFALLSLVVVLPACGSETADQGDITPLAVVTGDSEVSYTVQQLQALPAETVDGYTGVTLAELLQHAGIDPTPLSSVNAIASDGFSATYEPDLIMAPDTLVAYGHDGGDLPADEQPLRMVLPEQPGRLNVRMLVRLEAVQ